MRFLTLNVHAATEKTGTTGRVKRLQFGACFPCMQPVFPGADRLGFAEKLGKVAQGGKTQQLRDLGHG